MGKEEGIKKKSLKSRWEKLGSQNKARPGKKLRGWAYVWIKRRTLTKDAKSKNGLEVTTPPIKTSMSRNAESHHISRWTSCRPEKGHSWRGNAGGWSGEVEEEEDGQQTRWLLTLRSAHDWNSWPKQQDLFAAESGISAPVEQTPSVSLPPAPTEGKKKKREFAQLSFPSQKAILHVDLPVA